MTTATQKIRQTITGSPLGELHFQHQGEDVVRWLTGGTLPDAWVIFHHEGDQIIARCAGCQNILGYLPEDFEQTASAEQITVIRQAGHENHKPTGWPREQEMPAILEEIAGPEDLQRRIDARRGFLANRKADRLAYTVHDLSHFCNAPVEFTPDEYPKYFAEDTREFTQAWSATGWLDCGNCRHMRLSQPGG